MKIKICIMLLLSICCVHAAETDDFGVRFEEKYQSWKQWRNNHLDASSCTKNKTFDEIVDLGAPAVPYLIRKMEENSDDFHLQCAVYRIMKKKFEKEDWPKGKLGDSKTSSKMYIKWWKEDRANTTDQAESIFLIGQELKTNGDLDGYILCRDKIKNLGVDVLPFLIDKLEDDPDLMPAVVGLTNGQIKKEWRSTECKEWMIKNKNKIIPPH